MSDSRYQWFDRLLPDSQADDMMRLCENFGSYGLYSQEASEVVIGEGLAQRHDVICNFLETGGRFGRRDSPLALAVRTNYFRESYSYGDRVVIEGIEPFLHHQGFIDAARKLYDRPVIEPAIVFANILVPGQELAIHTDVPEFRGANRMRFPQWLMVVMHHSGLFEEWRMPIATGVAWFGGATGGEFVFYPEGPNGPAVAKPAAHNSAVLLDTDTVFHGVDRVRGHVKGKLELQPSMKLAFENGAWVLRAESNEIGRLDWGELRFSVSWKAYCFRDEDERATWRQGSDDLHLDFILDRLMQDLRRRDRVNGTRPDDTNLAKMLIAEYVRFPPPAS